MPAQTEFDEFDEKAPSKIKKFAFVLLMFTPPEVMTTLESIITSKTVELKNERHSGR